MKTIKVKFTTAEAHLLLRTIAFANDEADRIGERGFVEENAHRTRIAERILGTLIEAQPELGKALMNIQEES